MVGAAAGRSDGGGTLISLTTVRTTSATWRSSLAVAACAAIVATAGGASETLSAAVGARPEPEVFLSPSGSDATRCTKAAPCASFNRAYAVAQPGQTVQVAGGTYPAQEIVWRSGRDKGAAVVFRPAGRVTIEGNLSVHASGVHIAGQATGRVTNWRSRTYSITVANDLIVAGDSATQKPYNVTVEGIDADSLQTMTAVNVIARDIDSGPIVQGAACDRPQPKIGANVDGEIGGSAPRNHTWERVVVHGQDISLAGAQADCHTGGMFIVNGDGITIRDSVFTENVIYNIQVQNYVGAPARNVVIENNWFTCPTLAEWEAPQYTCNGQASIQFNAPSTFTNWLIRYNSFAINESVYGNGFDASFANVRFVGNVGQKPGPDVCGRAGITFSYNGWVGGKCGPTDASVTSPFVSLAKGAYDLRLRPGTRAAGLVVGSGPDFQVALDIERRMRPVRAGRDAGAVQLESAEIVPTRAIGSVRLKMSRDDVIDFYGRPRQSKSRSGIRSDMYRAHGGTLSLRYRDNRVVAVGTTSGYYTTRNGLGPGSSIRDAPRLLRARWDECRGLYRRAGGGGVVYVKPDRARRTVVTMSIVARSAEEPCSHER